MANKTEYHLHIEQDNLTAVEHLASATSLSRQYLKQCMQKGAVWLTRGQGTQRLRRAKKALRQGDELHFYYNPKVLEQAVTPAELLADEGDYSVWNKPYGMLSQGSKWGDHCTIYRWAEQHLTPERPAFIVHRLDRAASGLILLAHKKRVARQLADLFQQRQITKHYRVWVSGEFDERNKSITTPLDNKPATSHFHVLKYNISQQRTLLNVCIETGRKHQIRRHLSSIGFPVIGDRLYGDKNSQENLQLKAAYLSFTSPITGKKVEYWVD